jgi:NitT/TauT family transport system permease protein
VLTSGIRVIAGFSISIVLGGLLGMGMWRNRTIDALLGGLCLGLQTLPSVCWVPIATLTLGLSESGLLFVVVMGSFFAVAIALRDGLRTIPPISARAGRMLGASGFALYQHVLLPASLPALATALRHGFAFAWRSLMGAELIFMLRAHGIGYLLYEGREFADVAQVVGMMVIMIVVGMLADRLGFAPLERRIHAQFGLHDSA